MKMVNFPKKCNGCGENFCKEWIVGVIPRLLSFVSVLIECNNCKKVYQYRMPVYLVSKFRDFLPNDENMVYVSDEKKYITKPDKILTKEDEDMFIDILETNPLKLIKSLQELDTLPPEDYGKFKDSDIE